MTAYGFETTVELPTEPEDVKVLLDWVEGHQVHGPIPGIGVSRAFNRLLSWQERDLLPHLANQGTRLKFWFVERETAMAFASTFKTQVGAVIA